MFLFSAPQNLKDSRDFCRAILPALNIFLLLDQEIKTQKIYKEHLKNWDLEEQIKTFSYILCSQELEEDILKFLFSFLKTEQGHFAYVPEQLISPEKFWILLSSLVRGILNMDLSSFPPSLVGFLSFPSLEEAVLRTKQIIDIHNKEDLLAELFQAMFVESAKNG